MPASSLVSVVLPTVGRPELDRAVTSALKQRNVQVEVIVVVDRAEADAALVPQSSDQVRVIYTGGGKGGATARNIGVAAARGAYIAFLDDDDYWSSLNKLAIQVSAAREIEGRGSQAVVSCRFGQTDGADAKRTGGLPRRLYAPAESVAEYLFYRRRPGAGRASLPVPTLLTSASLARVVTWRDDLKRHQDWDWLIRATADPNVELVQIADDLVTVTVGSPGSISASADWLTSFTWARETILESRILADFLAAQCLRYALHARDGGGVRKILAAFVENKRLPTLSALAVGVAGIMPRRTLQRMMRRVV